MKENVTFGLGGIALIDKADDSLDGYFDQILDGVGGKDQDFIPCVKILIANRMGDCHSICRSGHCHNDRFSDEKSSTMSLSQMSCDKT